jgi:hypothetical protein
VTQISGDPVFRPDLRKLPWQDQLSWCPHRLN